jgi:hypothetical protein
MSLGSVEDEGDKRLLATEPLEYNKTVTGRLFVVTAWVFRGRS